MYMQILSHLSVDATDEEHWPRHEEGHDQGDQHHGRGIVLEHRLDPGLGAKHFDKLKAA